MISTCFPYEGCIISGYTDTTQGKSTLKDPAWYMLYQVSILPGEMDLLCVGKSPGRLGNSQWMTVRADVPDLCRVSLVI